jgi:hypothetical protein
MFITTGKNSLPARTNLPFSIRMYPSLLGAPQPLKKAIAIESPQIAKMFLAVELLNRGISLDT